MSNFLDDLLGSLGVQSTHQQTQEIADRIKLHEENRDAGKSLESKILEDKKKKRESAIKSTKKEAHKWTSKLRQIATSDQVVFRSASIAGKANNVRTQVETYKPDDGGLDLLTALQDSGVVEDRCLSLKSLKPSDKILEQQAARAAQKEKSRLKLLMQREQAKAAWHNRQKGKGHRRKLKKKMEKDQKKLIEALEKSNPEVIAKIRKDYEDQRAAIRMMPNHAKRKKWARIATKFGASDAVADDAARFFEKKRETHEVLDRINGEEDDLDEHSGSVSDSSYSSSTSDDSDSEISVENEVSDDKVASVTTAERPKKRPAADTSVDASKDRKSKKSKKLPEVLESDLTAFTGDNPAGDQTVAEMFVGSGADEADNAIREIAETEYEDEGVEANDDDMLIGWGGGWAGDNYAEKLEEKRIARNEELEKQLKEKKKRPIYINRKLSKKFEKYFCSEVPKGFTSEAEYKLKMSQAVGPEWNTSSGVKEKIKQQVYVENGTIIQPLGNTEIIIGSKKERTVARL